MKLKQLLIVLTLGLVLALGMLWLLDGRLTPVTAAPAQTTHYAADADGDLDPTFDTDGIVTTNVAATLGGTGDDAYAVAIQSDGKIVVAGSAYDASGHRDFAVARYGAAPPPQPVGGTTEAASPLALLWPWFLLAALVATAAVAAALALKRRAA